MAIINFGKAKKQFENALGNARKAIEGQDTSSQSGQDVFEEARKGSGESLFQKAQNQQASNIAAEGAAAKPEEEKTSAASPTFRTPEQGEDKTQQASTFHQEEKSQDQDTAQEQDSGLKPEVKSEETKRTAEDEVALYKSVYPDISFSDAYGDNSLDAINSLSQMYQGNVYQEEAKDSDETTVKPSADSVDDESEDSGDTSAGFSFGIPADSQDDVDRVRKANSSAENVLIAGVQRADNTITNFKPISSTPFYDSSRETEKSINNNITDYSDFGNVVSGTLGDDASIPMDAVGVSMEYLVHAYLNGGEDIRNEVKKRTELTPDDLIGADGTDNALREALKMTFTYENQIRVPTSKYPVSEDPSMMSRIIVVGARPGITLHPVMAKQYKADFDGDTMSVGFSTARGATVKRASAFFVSSANEVLPDEDFFGLRRVFDFSKLDNDIFFALETKEISDLLIQWSQPKYVDGALVGFFRMSRNEADRLANIISKNYKGQIAAAKGEVSEAPSFYADLMKEIVRYAYAEHRDNYDTVACGILQFVYDFGHDVRMIDAVCLDFQSQYLGPMASGVLEDVDLTDQVEVSFPSPPANAMDLMTAFNFPIARREGKNVIYRLTANLGKAVKSVLENAADPNGWISPKQWKSTVDDLFSLMMASRVTHSDKMIAMNATLRARVVRQVGVPNLDPAVGFSTDPKTGRQIQQGFEDFLYKFTKAYNLLANSVNAAGSQFTTDLRIIEKVGVGKLMPIKTDKNGRPQSLNDVADPFLKIYGEFTMRRLFGNFRIETSLEAGTRGDFRQAYIPELHGNMTLAQWVTTTRYAAGSTVNNGQKTPIEGGERGVRRFIRCLADLRDKYDFNFYKNLDKALYATVKQMRQFDNKVDNADYVAVSEGLLSTMRLLGKNAFDYYGMNSVDGIRRSKFGRRLINACLAAPNDKSAKDKLGSEWISLMTRYRLAPIMEMKSEWLDAKESGECSEESLAKMRQKWEAKLDELAGQSDLWKALVQDYRDGGSAITDWALSDSLGFEEKCKKLITLVRKDRYDIDRNKVDRHVPAMLVATGMTPTVSNLYITDLGHGEWLNSFKKVVNSMDSYVKKNIDDIDTDVEKTMSYLDANNLSIGEFFKDLANGNYLLTDVEPELLSDSFAVACTPSYSATEKNQQEDAATHAHDSIMLAINGMKVSDLAKVDNAFLGEMSYDMFVNNPVIVAKCLTDPDYEVWVYKGDQLAKPYSQEAIFGKKNPTDQEIEDWLLANKRVAMALRRTTYSAGLDDVTYTSAISLEDTIKNWQLAKSSGEYKFMMQKAKSLLMDHPSFYAITALFTPITGKKQYEITEIANDKFSEVIKFLSNSVGIEREDIYNWIVEDVIPQFDVDWNDYEAAAKDNDLNWEYGLLGKDQIVESLCDFIVDLSDILENADVARHFESDEYEMPTFEHVKESELRNYSNQLQHWGGARTASATSVNGNESQKNAIMGFVANIRPDEDCGGGKTILIPYDEFQNRMDEFFGGHFADGTIIDDYSAATVAPDQDGNVEIIDNCTCESKGIPCKKHTPEDQTSNWLGAYRTSPVGAFLGINRSDSTEKNSIKAKAKPVDSSDSVIKRYIIDDYRKQNHRIRETVLNMASNGDVEGARRLLAEAFMNSNYSNDYKDLNIQQYYALAHLMLRVTDNGPVLVSLEQLNEMCLVFTEQILKDPNIKSDTNEDICRALKQKLEEWVPTESVDMNKVLRSVRVSSSYPFKNNNLINWYSSQDRNLELMLKYTEDYTERMGNVYIDPSRIDDLSKDFESKYRESGFAPYFKAYKWQPKEQKKNTGKKGSTNKKGSGKNYSYESLIKGGDKSSKGKIIAGFYKNKYRLLGHGDKTGLNYTEFPGPNISWLIEENISPQNLSRAIDIAKRNGNTMFIEGKVSDELLSIIRRETNGHYRNVKLDKGGKGIIIPFFELELNGSTPFDGSFNVGEFRFSPREIFRLVRDELDEFKLGDSSAAVVRAFAEMIQPKNTKREEFSLNKLFRRLINKDQGSAEFGVSIADFGAITQGLDWKQNGWPEFELGFEPNDDQMEQFGYDIKRYLKRLENGEVGPNGFITGKCRPNDIIGFAIAKKAVRNEIKEYWAPIYAFSMYKSGAAMKEFTINGDYENHLYDRNSIIVNYIDVSNLADHQFKLFQGWLAANKLMCNGNVIPDRKLKNGSLLHIWINAKSTESRELLSARNNIMNTLMWEARLDPFGYNLAELPTTFPNNPELKKKLLNGEQILDSEWADFIKNDGQFFSDAQLWENPKWAGMGSAPMNKWLCKRVQRILETPGISVETFLTSRNAKDGNTYRAFRWDVLYDHSDSIYQDFLMSFLNSMQPKLCPSYQQAEYNGELFYPDLRVDVPFEFDGKTHYYPQYIATGMHFLDSHYDGATGYSVNGKVFSVPAINAMALGGRPIHKEELDLYLKWALSRRSEGMSSTYLTSDNDSSGMVE